MAQRVTIKWNNEVTGQFLKGSEIDALLRQKAEAVASVARSIVPVKTGKYRASITVEKAPTPTRDRWRVAANVRYAGVVESKHGTLKKALNTQKH